MPDQGLSAIGITTEDLVRNFRKYSNNPNATAEDMLATINAQQERQRISVPLTAGRGTWYFPTPFPTGVVPVVVVQAETPQAADYLLDAKIIADTTTNTKTEFQVNRFNASQTLGSTLTAILNTVVQIFRPATDVATVTINCSAVAATA